MVPPIIPAHTDRPVLGIGFIVLAMMSISVNDMLIKQLSGDYALHQMVFTRSTIGIFFSLIMVQLEGGWRILRTDYPWSQVLRGLLIVFSNLTFFTALAVVPLADATAMFFVAPLLITLLSIPMLGEKVGPMRLGAVAVGFVGVVVMLRPWESGAARDVPLWVMALPVLAAFTYAMNQILTRRLGAVTKASALAVYIQLMFIVVSLGFFLVAGDGRYAEGSENASVQFLMRAWTWPETSLDRWLFVGLGLNSAIIGYCISAAYRAADAATVAPFEYTGLPLAVFWGWAIWGELPGPWVATGIVLILGSGLFVFARERWKKRRLVTGRRVHRRY